MEVEICVALNSRDLTSGQPNRTGKQERQLGGEEGLDI